MASSLRKVTLRNDPISIAVGIVVALATFYLIEAVVAYLIAPLISVFIGDSPFNLNSFTISTSEFRYGAVIEAAITFTLAVGAIYFLLGRRWGYELGKSIAPSTRACPECTSSISVAAKRCPYCTAVVQSGHA